MKILITGGTGLIGSELIKHLAQHQITLYCRDTFNAEKQFNHMPPGTISFITDLSSLANLDNIDVIINLAGEPIANKRWTTQQKQIICDSRWKITQQLVELIAQSKTPPATFISGSAVGFYGDQGQFAVDESLRVQSQCFTHEVCKQWEDIALKAESKTTRVCLLRTGVVLSPSGGALKKMLLPYRLGLGGPIGNGNQFMPWIHIRDMVNAILFIIDNPHLSGPINLSAPHPVTNQTFSETLANTLHRPHLFFTPAWLLKLAMGESATLLLDSIRVKPTKLTHAEFEFQFPRLDRALKQLLETSS